jgi:hypothetical protein
MSFAASIYAVLKEGNPSTPSLSATSGYGPRTKRAGERSEFDIPRYIFADAKTLPAVVYPGLQARQTLAGRQGRTGKFNLFF